MLAVPVRRTPGDFFSHSVPWSLHCGSSFLAVGFLVFACANAPLGFFSMAYFSLAHLDGCTRCRARVSGSVLRMILWRLGFEFWVWSRFVGRSPFRPGPLALQFTLVGLSEPDQLSSIFVSCAFNLPRIAFRSVGCSDRAGPRSPLWSTVVLRPWSPGGVPVSSLYLHAPCLLKVWLRLDPQGSERRKS